MTRTAADSVLDGWYGPATPVVRQLRACRPQRDGQVVLRRWSRVLLARCTAVGFTVLALLEALRWGPRPGHQVTAAMVGAILLLQAAGLWQCSQIRLVLQSGEIVLYPFRRAVVLCEELQRMYRTSPSRGNCRLVLETQPDRRFELLWFEDVLWDRLFDFSRFCEDKLRAHLRQAGRQLHGGQPGRRVSFSVIAMALLGVSLGSALCGLVLALR
ncbi:hypothetical protein [Streptomyces mirabilis]|uniref:hypothetical protein n=1 Tax=Streptomyces mirabilis TaxID=68239 RepID=UPI0036D77220